MNVWFSGDQHFSHARIIEYCKRPFDDVNHMNEILIQNHNSVVKPEDHVYHVGDFAFRNHQQFLKRLNGKHMICMGNHDDRKEVEKANFIWVRATAGVYVGKQYIWLAHFSHRVWDKCHHGSFHVWGHSHGGLPDYGKSCDVGVDNWSYMPVHYDQLVERFKDVENVKHH
jgi:calcineurin-like phosphoesterase family protein